MIAIYRNRKEDKFIASHKSSLSVDEEVLLQTEYVKLLPLFKDKVEDLNRGYSGLEEVISLCRGAIYGYSLKTHVDRADKLGIYTAKEREYYDRKYNKDKE